MLKMLLLLILSVYSIPTCPPSWASLTPTQLTAVNFTTCPPDSNQQASIPPPACFGLNRDQLSVLNDCSGFTDGCMTYISGEAFEKISRKCLRSFSQAAMVVFSKDQAKSLEDDAWRGFTTDQLGVMNVSVFSVVSPTAASKIDQSACSGLRGEALIAMEIATFGALNGECWRHIPPREFELLAVIHVNAIAPTAFPYITADQIRTIPAFNCMGLTFDQTSYMSTACGGLSSNCINHMSDDAVGGLGRSPSCVGFINASEFISIREDKLLNLDCSGYLQMDAEKWNYVLTRFGSDFVTSVDSHKIRGVRTEVVNGIINDYWGKSFNLVENTTFSVCDSNSSWLKAMFSPGSSAKCLSGRSKLSSSLTTFTNVFAGLRDVHAPHVPTSFFSDSPRLDRFSESFISALSVDQIKAIPCGAFYDFDNLKSLDHSTGNPAFQSVTPLQLSAYVNTNSSCFVTNWQCGGSLGDLNESQLSFFASENCTHRCCRILIAEYEECSSAVYKNFSTSKLYKECSLGKYTDVERYPPFNSCPIADDSTADHKASVGGHKKTWLYVGIPLGILLIIGAIFAYRYYKDRNDNAPYAPLGAR